MTEPRKSTGWFISGLGLWLLAFSALWAAVSATRLVWDGLPMCPAYVTLAQALLCFVVVALAAKGDALRNRKP